MSAASRFHVAHAAGPWAGAVKDCLHQLSGACDGANLGFVYVTDALADDLSAIVTFLRQATGIGDWVGTIGIGVCATGVEYFDEPAIALLIASLPDDSFRVFPTIAADPGAFRRDNQAWIERARPGFGIVHGDPRNPRIPALVAGLAEAACVFLVGGLTSSRRAFEQVARMPTQGGLSGVLFAAEIEVATGLTQGCSPVGPVHTVSEGFDNVVVALDGRPALEVIEADLGEPLGDQPTRLLGTVEAALPVAGSDTGDYLVRSLIGIDARQGALVIGDRIAAGDKVMFVRRGCAAAEADMQRMLAALARRIARPPAGGVYVACVGRGPAIFTGESCEADMIRATFGDFPLVGFFANGEISNNRLYGYTGVLTLFL